MLFLGKKVIIINKLVITLPKKERKRFGRIVGGDDSPIDYNKKNIVS